MDNKDKIIKETAQRMNLPINVVRAIVSSPFDLASKTIIADLNRSIYIKKVGTFLAPAVRERIFATQKERWAEKKLRKSQEEDPTEFN